MITALPAAIFFDLDGTLVDTAPDFHAGVNRLRHQRGLPALPYDTIRAVVSEGARAVIAAGFPDLEPDSPEFDALRQQFLAEYSVHLADHSRLFDGLDRVLQALETRNIPWGVVTNKASTYTNPLMAALALDQRSAATICPDHVSQTKPHPEPLFKAAELAGVNPAQCIYVGDHVRDIEAGRRAGMLTVAVGWGYVQAGDSPASWGADVLCESVDSFSDWLSGRLDSCDVIEKTHAKL